MQDKEKAVTDQRRYSLIDPSSETEILRLQHRLVSTEDVLRNALEQGQQMEKLMEAMRSCSEKAQVSLGDIWTGLVNFGLYCGHKLKTTYFPAVNELLNMGIIWHANDSNFMDVLLLF